ncbi:MAG: hypothetical protein EHM42_06190 [Planctomycetaceae bacterium]|nr:MAG: hypothetical protein EHM42_06190 [Planctomycetaceae bacterium]
MTVTTEGVKKKNKASDGESTDPVQVVREGAIAASIWRRQSPSGYAYYDFTLSRSWNSASSGKMGYSKSFFEGNRDDLLRVIEEQGGAIHLLRQALLPKSACLTWCASTTCLRTMSCGSAARIVRTAVD